MDVLIGELAGRQHGVVSLSQLSRLGLTRQAVARRATVGRLHRVHQGVYAVGHRRLTRDGRWLAAVLAYGSEALLSHRSALALHGLRPDNRQLADVTVPRARAQSRAGIRVHGSTSLVLADRAVVEGIPCTSLPRTVLDCASRLGCQGVEKVVERAEVLRVFDRCEFAELLARAPGQRGVALVRAVLDELREPDWTENDYEAAVLALVRASAFPEPICQAPMLLDGEPVRIDFLWPVERVALEADSYEFHGTRQAFERDRRRDQLLRLAGYQPVRITWRQLSRHPEQVEELLRRLLGRVS
jgi:predicted transcriptional regulator of viral defense system